LSLPIPTKRAQIYETDATDAAQARTDKKNVLQVQFNPETLSISYSIPGPKDRLPRIKQVPSGSGALDFKPGATLSVNLLFDQTMMSPLELEQMLLGGGPKSVIDAVGQLEYFTGRHRATTADYPTRPTICFAWGQLLFVGQLSELGVNYTFFSLEGTPLRAEVKLSIQASAWMQEVSG